MSPLENFEAIFQRLLSYGNVCGISLLVRPIYPISGVAKLCLVFGSTLMFSYAYTILTAEPDVAWRCASIMPLMVQGFAKYYVYIKYLPDIVQKFVFLRRIYTANTDLYAPNYWLLHRWSERILLVIRHGWIPILVCIGTFVAIPAWNFLVHRQRDLLLDIHLIGVDHRSWGGYLVHSIYHTLTGLLACAGNCFADFTMVALVLHLWPMAAIWRQMWQRMDRALLAQPQRLERGQRLAYFRHMLNVHRDITAYLTDISNIFESMTFFELYTDSGMMCLLLFCYFKLKWQQALMFGITLAIKLMTYSLSGTLVELATDRVYIDLLDIAWYMLPVDEQKILIVVLLVAQQPQLLQAGILPLNLDTGLEALKTVYSVGMLLVQL